MGGRLRKLLSGFRGDSSHCTRARLAMLMFAGSISLFACDLLNQTPIIREGGFAAKQAPLSLATPDSVVKMLVYIFDRHTPETARQFADLLAPGYVYRYDDPTDQNQLELDRASEIRVYENIFRNFETISAEFIVESRWTEYGSAMTYPAGTTTRYISERHPNENWTVLQVIGDMEFSNTDEQARIVGYRVFQRFELGFRFASATPDSTWQLASWTDRESLISARITHGE
ncbi:MAG TPA: hypothetical protein ENN56_04995 [Firmicutes bacterium]|nr:hypothetical protein [Bacillota bacterium]